MPILIPILVSIVLSAASYMLMRRQMGKQQGPAAEKATLPDEKDGKVYRRVFGTVWIDDPAVIAMKQTGADEIQK